MASGLSRGGGGGIESPQGASGRGRYEAILLAFTRLVAARGYADANLSEIAEELGISKGTIVYHYRSKDRLFAAMHDRYMTRCLTDARAIVARLDPGAEQLAGLLFSFVGYQLYERDATVATQREFATLTSHEALKQGRELRRAFIGLVREVIRSGIENGQFRPTDVETTSLLIMGSTQWAWTWFRSDGRLPMLQVGSELVQLVLGGLSTSAIDMAALSDVEGVAATVAIEQLEITQSSSLEIAI